MTVLPIKKTHSRLNQLLFYNFYASATEGHRLENGTNCLKPPPFSLIFIPWE